MSPADVFAAGVALAQKVLGNISLWHPESSVSLMIAALVVCGAYALIAAEMFVTIIQSYICISAGVFNMAFGGSQWTREIAISTMKYPVSIGAKLMILQLIVSVGQGLMIGWAEQFKDMTNASLMELIGCSIVMLYLVKTLPSEFQRIVGGAGVSSGSGLIGTGMEVAAAGAAVAGGAASVAANAAGVGAATWQAGKFASSQSANGDGSFAGNMAKNIGGAAMTEAGRRLRGDINSQHGHGSWRMATDMQGNHRRYLRDIEAEKKSPPSPDNSIS
jgi:type IV secretion system protein TrbL